MEKRATINKFLEKKKGGVGGVSVIFMINPSQNRI